MKKGLLRAPPLAVPPPLPAGTVAGQQSLMLWIDRDELGDEATPGPAATGGQSEEDYPSPGFTSRALSWGAAAARWIGLLARVCGGPVYLVMAAVSPCGFATFEGASRHGGSDTMLS